jgi:hypothetical protein
MDPTVSAAGAGEITLLLKAWAGGDVSALDRLTPLVYGELRRQARRHMRQERAGHTLQGTALVNEAYLRLAEIAGIEWESTFLRSRPGPCVASWWMRRVPA